MEKIEINKTVTRVNAKKVLENYGNFKRQIKELSDIIFAKRRELYQMPESEIRNFTNQLCAFLAAMPISCGELETVVMPWNETTTMEISRDVIEYYDAGVNVMNHIRSKVNVLITHGNLSDEMKDFIMDLCAHGISFAEARLAFARSIVDRESSKETQEDYSRVMSDEWSGMLEKVSQPTK